MCKLSVLPWVVTVLFVGTLMVWFLAPAEAQEVSNLEGVACAQYSQCGGGSGTDPGVPRLAPVSASAPASPPPSSVTPDTDEDDSDRPDRNHRKYGAKDETKVGKDAKQGARDATGALGRVREGEHKGGDNRTEVESGWLGLAENFVRLSVWSASDEDVAATGPQVAPSEPAEAAPVTDTVVEDGEEPLTEAAEASNSSAEVNLAKADNGETQYVHEVASVKWMDSEFMESRMEGAEGGELDAEPDGNGVETAGGSFSESATGSNVAQVSKSDGPPDLAVAGLGPDNVNTESRHGGATLVAGAGSLLVATALGVLAMIVCRRRSG